MSMEEILDPRILPPLANFQEGESIWRCRPVGGHCMEPFDIYQRLTSVNGQSPHGTEDFRGERYSVVRPNPKLWCAADNTQVETLKEVGFNTNHHNTHENLMAHDDTQHESYPDTEPLEIDEPQQPGPILNWRVIGPMSSHLCMEHHLDKYGSAAEFLIYPALPMG